MDRIKENEIYDNFQDLCNSHKEISHFGDKHMCNTECPLRDTNRCENVFFYQQGRAGAITECLQIVQKIKDDYNDARFGEQIPINYGTLCGIIIEMEQLKEQKNG